MIRPHPWLRVASKSPVEAWSPAVLWVLAALGALSLPACDAALPLAGDDLEEAQPATDEASMRIPVAFGDACQVLAEMSEPPPGFTVAEFFACLTDESWRALDALWRKEAARAGAGAPATLAELVASYGDAPVDGVPLRELALGAGYETRAADGVQPASILRYRFPSQYGLDPTKCSASCLSAYVNVVGGRRRIGFGPALKGAVAIKDDQNRRYLDEIYPGTFPDFHQADLADQELKDSGCGPVSAINLFEWWGIPMFNRGVELTSFDARASYIAGRMQTLDGLNFTDDDDLIDFVTSYPREMRDAGRIPGYPGYHYMRDDPEGFKVMMSYLARGFPVIALYATSSDSLHWALITGVKGGKLLIANAGDRTIADFYDQWQDWQSLEWYADVGAGLFVVKSTFIAYTGWGPSKPPPDRFATRTAKASLPSYTTTSTYLFRYCVGAADEIGREAEALHVDPWASEPSGSLPGYCMFMTPTSKLSLQPSPAGGTASSASGATLTLSVANSAAFSAFAAANPGVRCQWYGQANGVWTQLADKRCSDPAARSYSFTNTGQYAKVSFHVHSVELAKTRWSITAN